MFWKCSKKIYNNNNKSKPFLGRKNKIKKLNPWKQTRARRETDQAFLLSQTQPCNPPSQFSLQTTNFRQWQFSLFEFERWEAEEKGDQGKAVEENNITESMEDGEIEEGSIGGVEEEEQQQSSDQRKSEESPYEMMRNSKASIENIIADMLSIKKEGKPKQLLRDLVTQMFLHFITLRQVLYYIYSVPLLSFSNLGFLTLFFVFRRIAVSCSKKTAWKPKRSVLRRRWISRRCSFTT